ncbi:MAG: FAD-dependent monooxygenase [Bacteroidota bacterium]
MRISKGDPILIIGGGLSGLITAVTLFHHDFKQVRIFEQKTDLGEEKTPVFLTSAAQEALEAINMGTEIAGLSPKIDALEWLWKGNKSLRKIQFDALRQKKGNDIHILSKEALLTTIRERLPEDWMITGQEFISFTQNDKQVEAHFSGNTNAKGVMLIGADGRNSRVCLQLKGGGQVRSTNLITYRAILDRNVLADPNHSWLTHPCVEVMDGGRSASLVPINDRQAGLLLTLPTPTTLPSDAQDIKTWLQEAFSKFPAPIPAAIGQTWPASFLPEPHQDSPIRKGWSQGRVVLVGDAAHTTDAFLGFNDSLSLTSAGVLGAQIADQYKRIERGFQRYEKQRLKASKRFQKAARTHTKFIGNSNVGSTVFRNMFMGFMPIGLTAKRLTRILGE